MTRTVTGTVDMSASYKYDAFGNRIEKTVTQGGTATTSKFVLDAWKKTNGHLLGNENWDVWAELDGSGSLKTQYLRGDGTDQLFGHTVYSGGTCVPNWDLTDMRGSVRDIVNNSGTSLDQINYGAFGNISSETNSANRGRYAWTGRELDVESNLQFNRARYYDSGTGRWLTQDPLGFNAGDSNLYRYVKNRPTVESDPSGLQFGDAMSPQADRILPNEQIVWLAESWRLLGANNPTMSVRIKNKNIEGTINVYNPAHLRGQNKEGKWVTVDQGIGISFEGKCAKDVTFRQFIAVQVREARAQKGQEGVSWEYRNGTIPGTESNYPLSGATNLKWTNDPVVGGDYPVLRPSDNYVFMTDDPTTVYRSGLGAFSAARKQ